MHGTSFTTIPPRLCATKTKGRSRGRSLPKANRRSLLCERRVFLLVGPDVDLVIFESYPNVRNRETGHSFGSKSRGQNKGAPSCLPGRIVTSVLVLRDDRLDKGLLSRDRLRRSTLPSLSLFNGSGRAGSGRLSSIVELWLLVHDLYGCPCSP